MYLKKREKCFKQFSKVLTCLCVMVNQQWHGRTAWKHDMPSRESAGGADFQYAVACQGNKVNQILVALCDIAFDKHACSGWGSHPRMRLMLQCDRRIEPAKRSTAVVTERRYWTFTKNKRILKKARKTTYGIEDNCQQILKGVDNFQSFLT